MPVHMSQRRIDGRTHILIDAPDDVADRLKDAVSSIIALLDAAPDKSDSDTVSWSEAFPDRHPGHVLAGARYRENMTQKALAARVGCRPSHISEMEHGRRPIGKDMAKRLAAALNTAYKVFL